MKNYIEASIEFSGYKVIMRIDKEIIIENYKHLCLKNKMMKNPHQSIRTLIKHELLHDLKSIIGSENNLKLVKI